MRCSACIERNCLTASGSSAARTTNVSRMIDRPQLAPTLSWKNLRIDSKTSISGCRMFAVMGTMGSGVRGPRRGGGRRTEEALLLDRVVAAVTPRVAAQQPPAGEDQAPEYAEPPDGLRGVAPSRSARTCSAAGSSGEITRW